MMNSLKNTAKNIGKDWINNKATITIKNMDGVSSCLYQDKRKTSFTNQASNKISKGVTDITSQINKAAKSLLHKTGLMDDNTKANSVETFNQGQDVITVAYNPSTIRISTSFMFSVSLIFTSKFPTDHSVHDQIERFMAFMFSSLDRKVTFAWGNHLFHGILTNANAKYLNFETTGNPTYATIDITIQGMPDNISKKFENIENQRNSKESEGEEDDE